MRWGRRHKQQALLNPELAEPTDPGGYRLPDFTVSFEGVTIYWEHLRMLDVDSHARNWWRKRDWYARNGFIERLITSADAPGGGLSVSRGQSAGGAVDTAA
jgi:exodeoxyribonuclease V alpha subunit